MIFRRMAIFQLLITLFLLLALEIAARLAFTLYAGPLYVNAGGHEPWLVYTADLGWDRRPGFKGLDGCLAHREFDSHGFVSADSAKLRRTEPTKRRVMFLGDSNTYGFCVATQATFVEVANRLLPGFDLLNFGVPGYTSYQGYEQLIKYGGLIKPDSIFISFNFNDRRYAPGGTDVDSDATFRRYALAPKIEVLEYSYLYRFVRASGRKLGLIKPPVAAATELRADILKPRVDLQSYRTNLIKMVEWAKQHGSTPYFILLGDNPNQTDLLRKGIASLEQKNYERAIGILSLLRHQSNSAFGALARKYLSRAYRETGNVKLAEQVLTLTPRPGGEPLLQDVDYNNAMRDVARDYNVVLVDAKAILDENSRVYFDACHFNAEGHELIARLIRDVLTTSGR